MDPVWYFITFWIGRYLADVYHWGLKKIGWFAMFPFIVPISEIFWAAYSLI
jgi:ACS family hexuronate transporter-like MFS transporter